jgi:hypothetical protein
LFRMRGYTTHLIEHSRFRKIGCPGSETWMYINGDW